MDLDDLRHALDEAALRRAPHDVSDARVLVGVRAQRRRRRQRSIASATLLVGAIAVIVAVLAIAGGGTAGRAPVVKTPPASSYGSLPPRDQPAMAYDAARGDVVLFGGVTTDTPRGDTWRWDGRGWTHAHPALSPPARAGAAMAYDPNTRTVLLFGGVSERPHESTLARDDMWSWNGTTWTRVVSAHEPPWSSGLAMSYDPASKSMILVTLPSNHPNLQLSPDGVASRGTTPFGTWSWNGTDWRELPTPSAPLFAIGAVFHGSPRLTPLPDDAGLLLYSWAVYTGSCVPIPPGSKPPTHGPCANLPDPNGTVDSQTWTWDGTRWSEQHPAHAPGDTRLVVTVDRAPTAFTAIARWTWTGSGWRSSRPATGPFGAFAVSDVHDHDIVAYDGTRTWIWNGTWVIRDGAPPTSTGSPVTSATTATSAPVTSSASPVTVGTTATSTSAPVTSTSAPVRTCTSSQLHLAFDKDLGSLMQQPGAYFALTNGSTAPCTLDGYPKVQLFDTAGRSVATRQYDGSSYQINDPGARVVTVAPGATVYFGFGWSDVNQADGGSEKGCVSIGSGSVVPPGNTHALVVTARLSELFCPPGASVTAVAPKGAFNPSQP